LFGIAGSHSRPVFLNVKDEKMSDKQIDGWIDTINQLETKNAAAIEQVKKEIAYFGLLDVDAKKEAFKGNRYDDSANAQHFLLSMFVSRLTELLKIIQ
jgi:hypothetical protein